MLSDVRATPTPASMRRVSAPLATPTPNSTPTCATPEPGTADSAPTPNSTPTRAMPEPGAADSAPTPNSTPTRATPEPGAADSAPATSTLVSAPLATPTPNSTATLVPAIPHEAFPRQYATQAGNPLARFIDRSAPAPPNLLDSVKMPNRHDGRSDSTPGSKKGAKSKIMIPNDKRTARNLYAVVYMRLHPEANTKEFDTAWKTSEDSADVQKVSTLASLAREKNESLECIIDAFNALSDDDRKVRCSQIDSA
ncbi:hypothetical protein OH76DRAFT_1366015 [Lentinus brumalis]|uniref:Uncharacterized protein n=1 Tax=Lentinus brumalis TaxID=2498619 RepID=A0A371CJY9_9APHY|nr:hypothetical protein OH76DRAFT_1366015 [Polyporus brumalis]